MSGKGSSLISKVFIAIIIFAFTLWWISPTQCPEAIPVTQIQHFDYNLPESNVNLENFKDLPQTNTQQYLGSQFEICKQPMIVTAANAQYFPSLQNLVGSLKLTNGIKLTIIDLGMTNDQRSKITTWCHAELIGLKKEYQDAVTDMTSQAWIPLATDQLISASNDVCVLYLDPRIEVHSSLWPVFQEMETNGYWFASTGKDTSMTWLGQNDATLIAQVSPYAFGIASSGLAFEKIIPEWKNCALKTDCSLNFLNSDPINLLNGIIYLKFQQLHENQFNTKVEVHTDKKYTIESEKDIDSATLFYLRPAQGVYPYATSAGSGCSRVVSEGVKQPEDTQPVKKQLKSGGFVVMAANQVVKYCFYIPVSALIWKERYGYDGIIMLIGDEQKWRTEPHLQIITKYLDKMGISFTYIVNTTDTYSTSLSQLARIFAPYLPNLDITDDSFIITSDSDLWPINPNLYKITEPGKEILLLNSACCGGFTFRDKHYTMFPMGHIGMSLKTWKEVMNVPTERQKLPFVDMVLAEGSAFFGEDHLQNVQHGGKGWYNDQQMISVKIGDWSGFPAKAQREVPGGLNRIDRAWWPGSFTKESVLNSRDAHLLHGLDNWNRVAEVLKYLIPHDKFQLANDYAMEFITAHPEPN